MDPPKKYPPYPSGKPAISCDQCLQSGAQCRFNPAKEDKCRGCHARSLECVWTQVPKPLPPPDSSYIEYLEARVKEVESYLKTLLPGINTKKELDTLLEPLSLPTGGKPNPTTTDQGRHETSNTTTPSPLQKALPSSTIVASTPATSRLIQQVRLANLNSDHARVDKIDDDMIWNDSLGKWDISRYHGLSSLEVLSRDAEIHRDGYNPGSIPSTIPTAHRRPEFWRPLPAEVRYIEDCPWNSEEGLTLDLPPDDLMSILVDKFFDTLFFPVIHRGMFEKQLKEGLHKRDGTFLRLVLLVCANGARSCDDPRVLDDRWPVSLSAGHRWFRQFVPSHKRLIEQISLHNAQLLTLLAIYGFGTSANYTSWITIGIAIRLMQGVGVHRWKSTQSLEDELFKRCFWTMTILDRVQCVTMDRHAASQDFDSDLGYILEVDDELWSLEPGAPPPVQPTGVSSPFKLCCFNQLFKLTRIAGRCLQTVYALESTKRQIGLDTPQGAAWMFNELNSQFNQWVRDVPSFLRFPAASNKFTRFHNDIAEMWGLYYDLLISANRPFIVKSSSPLAAPALKICCDGARECTKMLRTCLVTPGFIVSPGAMYPAFACAMILVVDLIAQGNSTDPNLTDQKAEDLRECMKVLKHSEDKFHIAGRLYDMVREFEEYWRLELSPHARSSGTAPPQASGDGLIQRPAQKLPFDPSDSVLPKVKVKVEDDATFDLTLPPPDTTPMIQTSSQIPDPLQFIEPAPSYDYAHPNAYANEMFAGLYSFDTSHLQTMQLPSSSQIQPEASFPSVETGSQTVGFQPYLPEYGYDSKNVLQQYAQRSASTSHLPLDETPGHLNLSSAAIPGLGVFLPSGWMNNLDDAEWADVPQQARESPEGTKSPVAQWDAIMYGTLGLHGRYYNPQARPK